MPAIEHPNTKQSNHQPPLALLASLRFLFLPTLLLILMASQAQALQPWNSVSDYFQQKMEDNGIVGGALVYVEDGDVSASNYYGKADIDKDHAVDENTIFHWASITKTFTSVAIMQLRDRGKLSLDDPVTKYLPEIRDIHNPYGSMDEVTISMVMSHATGLRNPTWPWGGQEDWHPFEPTKWSQLVAMFPYTEVEFEPGSKHSYSNPAIIFLGQIIEQITGESYASYMHKNLLMPLQMHNSYFNETPPHLSNYRSNSYTLHDGEPKANGPDFNTGITISNSGLNAPIRDMVNYLSFLAGNYEGPEILNRDSLEEMWEVRLENNETHDQPSLVGLGFFMEEFGDKKLIGHTGTQWSHYSYFYVHPETGRAVIGVTNTDSDDDQPNLFEIREELTNHIFQNLF